MHSWRDAEVILVPKPSKKHTDEPGAEFGSETGHTVFCSPSMHSVVLHIWYCFVRTETFEAHHLYLYFPNQRKHPFPK